MGAPPPSICVSDDHAGILVPLIFLREPGEQFYTDTTRPTYEHAQQPALPGSPQADAPYLATTRWSRRVRVDQALFVLRPNPTSGLDQKLCAVPQVEQANASGPGFPLVGAISATLRIVRPHSLQTLWTAGFNIVPPLPDNTP